VGWVTHQPKPDSEVLVDINAIFFDKFFTILILSDVFILLFSLMYTEKFPVIIRNSSFVISTILLKLSFSAEGWMAQLLIVVGVGFGVLMLYLSNAFDRMQKSQK
jgi:predicted neutral ceramidase superfamily lipid hydrolase